MFGKRHVCSTFCLWFPILITFSVEGNRHIIQRCDQIGSTKVVCQDQCNLAEQQCWQKAMIEKCSCHGFVAKLGELAVFQLDGTRISAQGFGFVDQCQPCAKRCSSIHTMEPEKPSEQTRRRYVVEARKHEDCQHFQAEQGGVQLLPPLSSRQLMNRNFLPDPLESIKLGPATLIDGTCSNYGNMTQICEEKCPLDGLTCSMRVAIEACTCAGRHVQVQEVAKYDMTTKKQIFSQTAFRDTQHSRVCGDCVEFCEFRPGERNEYMVNTKITTCFDKNEY